MEKSEKTWYVTDNQGNLAGHDMSEFTAQALAQQLQDEEPEAEWEALHSMY